MILAVIVPKLNLYLVLRSQVRPFVLAPIKLGTNQICVVFSIS